MISESATQTYQLGLVIGTICEGGEVIALNGELGSGKTVLTQGIAKGMGVHEYIHSPTFTIINEYSAPLWLFHADFYRLQLENEVEELGLEEYTSRKGVLVIEWANKFIDTLPAPRLVMSFKAISNSERELKIHTIGSPSEGLDEFMDIIKNAKSIDHVTDKVLNKVR